MIPVCEPVLDGKERAYVLDCLETNWISSEGPHVRAFEEAYSRYCGTKYGMACSSGTAAIGVAQCEKIEEKVARKREIARWYTELLRDEPHIALPPEAPWARSVYWMYGVLLHASFGCSRNQVIRSLKLEGIETRPFFHPLHRQPVFLQSCDPRFPETTGDYPVAERLGESGLYLPSGLSLTRDEVERVVAALRECREMRGLE